MIALLSSMEMSTILNWLWIAAYCELDVSDLINIIAASALPKSRSMNSLRSMRSPMCNPPQSLCDVFDAIRHLAVGDLVQCDPPAGDDILVERERWCGIFTCRCQSQRQIRWPRRCQPRPCS